MPLPAYALDSVVFNVAGPDDDLEDALKGASLVLAAQDDADKDTRDVFADALAEYGQLVQTLYANGYYSGVVKVRVDGREAAQIPVFEVPQAIGMIEVSVNPGKQFRFGNARAAPLAPNTDMPDEFRAGEVAKSVTVQQAADAAVLGWRQAGHAKVDLSGQKITANHANAQLSATLNVAPGPKVRFGTLRQTTESAVRSDRIARIAGFPAGQVFSPDELETVAKRLRRTGAFSSVTLTEAETLGAGNTMDIGLALVDEEPRRFGVGAELASLEGLKLSAFWMHRNMFGGAERLRIDGEISGIAGQHGGVDYRLGVRLDQPATFGPDTNAFVFGSLAYEDEPGYISRSANLGAGIKRIFSDTLEAEFGAALLYSETTDILGDRRFVLFTLPTSLTWDRRNDKLDATRGTYLKAEVIPFISLDNGGTGGWAYGDGRAYRGFGAEDRFVLAGRVQVGSVFAGNVGDIPPDYLFYSGGGGTVRGQPYQSLGLDVGGGEITGGQSFVSLSAELRAQITDKIGVVGFVDAGHVAAGSLFDGQGNWHTGGGIGVRYKTPIGPLRLDVAGPISGDTSDGVQIYLGIGQAF
ncbi:autotransporter assembly complex protein TamA [Aliiroseovarius sp. S1339]|uniref:autotransporter assembly complex protein TamA n=1 Tax=Aliiroseovarius sp. S1339 TaxID=2936990 RepID=UPI0020BE1D35|nr:autotransporter assembly complex family protein [Aliiroseovarius sp. S1339]MCK8465165.1 autotransporter assembly complex protein TamA [Aliiroseovarius sp. S1339]